MSKKSNFSQQIHDEDYYDMENESWGKYRKKDGKRENDKKAKIQKARRNKQAARESYFDE